MAIILCFNKNEEKDVKEDNYRLENQVEIKLENIKQTEEKLNDKKDYINIISVERKEEENMIIKNELIDTNNVEYNKNYLEFNNYWCIFDSFYFLYDFVIFDVLKRIKMRNY